MNTLKFMLIAGVVAYSHCARAVQPDRFVRYVESDGSSQYVDLQVPAKVGDGLKLQIGMMCPENFTGKSLVGATSSSGSKLWMLTQQSGFRAAFTQGTNQKLGPNVTAAYNDYLEATFTVENGCQSLSVDNGTYHGRTPGADTTTAATVDTGNSFYLFANNNGTADNFAKAQVYFLKLWVKEGGAYVLKRDMLPCVKDGRAGLYDKVSDAIFYSAAATDLACETIWTVYPVATDAKTPGQQLQYVFSNIHPGDTVVLKPGTYSLADIYMSVNQTKGKPPATNRLDLAKDKCENIIVRGETATSWRTWGKNAEPVILDAAGARHARAKDIAADSAPVRFENIAFVNADMSNYGSDTANNFRGGAISAYSTASKAAKIDIVASNCVFRNNNAYSASAGYMVRGESV